MATSPLPLPAELLHDIVLYLDRGSLISVAQSCRILNAVVVQHLYRTVPRLNGPDTIRCLNTFSAIPDIAGNIRTFNIYSSFSGPCTTGLPPAQVQSPHKGVWDRILSMSKLTSPPLSPVVPPGRQFLAGTERISLQTVANAFYNMKNLHTLIIHAPSHPRIWEFEHPITTLRTVFVHRNAESPSLFVWIMSQQSITYLRMAFGQKWFQLPIVKRDSGVTLVPPLPNLRSLTCNPQGVVDLFPCACVSELIIEDLFEEHETVVLEYLATVIACSSAEAEVKLQRLTVYGAKVVTISLLERLERLLPTLLFLRIFVVDCDPERVSSTLR